MEDQSEASKLQTSRRDVDDTAERWFLRLCKGFCKRRPWPRNLDLESNKKIAHVISISTCLIWTKLCAHVFIHDVSSVFFNTPGPIQSALSENSGVHPLFSFQELPFDMPDSTCELLLGGKNACEMPQPDPNM